MFSLLQGLFEMWNTLMEISIILQIDGLLTERSIARVDDAGVRKSIEILGVLFSLVQQVLMGNNLRSPIISRNEEINLFL